MELSLDQTATNTIELLEARLRRIEYILKGHWDERVVQDNTKPADARLKDLEHSFSQLVAKSRIMQDLLKLHDYHPDFFHTSEALDPISTLDIAVRLSIILAAASSFPQTASRLMSIRDTPVAPAESSVQLMEMRGRVGEVEVLQESQLRDIAVLKERTAAVLQRWYSIDIIQAGECWADVEARVEHAERIVRRATSVKEYDKDII